MLVWMAEESMVPGKQYLVKQATNLVTGTVSRLHYRVDVNTLRREETTGLAMNEVGRCTLTLSRPVAVDPYPRNRTMGAFIVVDRSTNRTVGAGMVLDRRMSDDVAPSAWDGDTREAARAAAPTAVSQTERATRFGQQPVTVFFTGLEASGKSTLAYALERRLFDAGRAVSVIDGTQMRQTISRDLGFTYADRSENVRRAADVARLFNDVGLIALVALLAPDAEVRAKAREAIGRERFLLVHVATPVDVCRARDSRGVYGRADAGELGDFPGVSAPYDPPTDADLVIDASAEPVEHGVERLVELLRARGVLD
jgi:bifunctional enzyme CysN/CysC